MQSEFTNAPDSELPYSEPHLIEALEKAAVTMRSSFLPGPKIATYTQPESIIARLELEIRRLHAVVNEQARNSIRRVDPPLFNAEPRPLAKTKAFSETIYGYVGPSLSRHERAGRSSGFVYIARSVDGLTKVGVTKNPAQRFKEGRLWNPSLRVIAILETQDMYGIETVLHSRFNHKHVVGEWFSLTDEEVLEIIEG